MLFSTDALDCLTFTFLVNLRDIWEFLRSNFYLFVLFQPPHYLYLFTCHSSEQCIQCGTPLNRDNPDQVQYDYPAQNVVLAKLIKNHRI